MEYNKVIKIKNQILCVAFAASILLRCIVNTIFIDFKSVIGLGMVGVALSAMLFLLTWKCKKPVIVEYVMVGILSSISILCMVLFPSTTNYMMLFQAIFFILIYEEPIPIILQCSISAVCMIVFYFQYGQRLAESWDMGAAVMCVVYVISGMFVFVSMCFLSRKSMKYIMDMNEESSVAREKAEGLLGEIGKSIGVLDHTSGNIKDSVTVTEEIAKQISAASEDIAKRALEEVSAANAIHSYMTDSVEQITHISESSTQMTHSSKDTAKRVNDSGSHVKELTVRMEDLDEKMQNLTDTITQLSQENGKIIEILSTLDSITSQTNLLSLNASIEAARAGEHGKGFAVVATEIRNLSDNSKQFTEQIENIVDGIHQKTEAVKAEILEGRESVHSCRNYVDNVEESFQGIAANTEDVLKQSREIEEQSKILDRLLNRTLQDVKEITDNVESTSSAMEEISSSMEELHGNIDSVVNGYHDINDITYVLTEASQKA